MSNKENFSAYKLEGPNLSVDPKQMKKKKRSGGYNVRKSLAWNKAFFTEEGVLDSEELSFIIGTPGNCSREVLSTISEERMNVPSDDFQAIGKNLFKDVPSASSKEEKSTVSFSLKHNSPASGHGATTSTSSIKALPNHGFRRTGTRDSGSQLPLPLSSLKRPAKNHMFQSAMKESKLPRTPVKKPGQSVVASTSKNAVGSGIHVKQTQTALPVASIKRNVGVTASKRSTKVVQNKSRAGSVAASHSKTNAVHLPIYFPSPTTLGATPSKMVDNSLPKVPYHAGPSFVVHSSIGRDESTAVGDARPQNTLVTGTAIQRRQMKLIKPSGLRLPSPSLGYFGQPKPSVPQRISSKAAQAEFSGLKQTGNCRPVQTTEPTVKIPKAIHTELINSGDMCCLSHDQKELETANEFIKMEGSISLDVSEPSEPRRDELMTKSKNDFNENLVNQVIRCLTGENGTVEDKLLVESESSRNLTGDGIVNHDILDSKECRESTGSGWEESKLTQQISVASTADASGARSLNGSLCNKVKDKSRKSLLIDDSVLMKSLAGEGFACAVQCSATTQITFMHDLYNLPKDCSESNAFSPDKEFLVPHRDQHSSVEGGSFSGQLEDSQNGRIANADSRAPADGQLKPENSEFSCQSMNSSPSMKCSERDITAEPMFQKTEFVADVILTPRRYQDNANECSQISDVIDPSLKGLTFRTNLEPISRIADEKPASCFLVEKGIVSKEGLQDIIQKLPHEVTDICINELNTSDAQTTKARARMQTEGDDVDKGAEETWQAIVEDPVFCSIEIDPPVETFCHEHTESISCNFIHNGEAISLGLSPKQSAAAEHGKYNASDFTIDGPENLTSLSSPGFNPCITNGVNGCLSADCRVLEGDKICHFHNIEEADSNLQTYSGIGFVVPQTLPHLENTGQDKIKEKEIADSFTASQTEDMIVQEFGGKEPVECSVNQTPELSDQGALLAWCTKNSGQAELADSRIMVENVPQCSVLPFGIHLSEERTTSGEWESSVFENGFDSVPKDAEHVGSESKGSRTVSTVCLSINVMCQDRDKVFNDSNAENTTSGCMAMEVQPSIELDKPLTWKQMNHDEEPGVKAVPFVNEENDGLKLSGLPGETKLAVPKDIHSLVKEPHTETETTLCASCSDKTMSTSNKNTLKIIPPINAAPFSDEWLAAVEAAGEDILTIKSGAVQNSPPEKIVPEPRPWSPVKRKNNSIGPYDCTKFTSH